MGMEMLAPHPRHAVARFVVDEVDAAIVALQPASLDGDAVVPPDVHSLFITVLEDTL